MKVLKFGGSSVGSPKSIEAILEIVGKRVKQGEKLVVVNSAFSGITDLLIEMSTLAAADKPYESLLTAFIERHNSAALTLLGKDYASIEEHLNENHTTLKNLLYGIQLVREISPRTQDYVLSFGERNSNLIIAAAFDSRGTDAEFLDARDIIKTNKDFGKAKVNFELTNPNITGYFSDHAKLQVVTGFIASDIGGLTTTLGRGGSDYTAAILAAALDAEQLEIWTDVDGVLTADPRKVKKAYTLPKLSYLEAMEMSHFGAKVIYPPTIQPVFKKGIPIYIKNTFNPEFEGTIIGKDLKGEVSSLIKGITSMDQVSLLRLQGSGLVGIPGVSSRLFGTLGRNGINIVMITQASSEHSICFAVAKHDAKFAKQVIEEEFSSEISQNLVDRIEVDKDVVIMAVVGESMAQVPGVAGNLFESLGKNGINVIAIAQGSSELNISFVIQKKDETKALNLIHDSFFLSDNRRINLYLVGVGLIGGTFIAQLEKQRKALIDRFKLEINLVGISNSRKMHFDTQGINLGTWKTILDEEGTEANVASFVQIMNDLNTSNSVFIDCTANKSVPDYYDEILKASISIVTPNKVATSSSYARYQELRKLAADRNIHFKYETNVGAGLPVISTIQNLINSGDNIRKIEAVVSGSLSFIFNNFDGSKKFSELVMEAKKLGYTEPDPREDLSGADVKRKLIILTREAGFQIESEDVVVHPILPEVVMNANGVEEFFQRLEENDGYFEELIGKARKENKVLRFVGISENGSASVSLQTLGPDSPFYSLESSDNMFVITTDRYAVRPLKVSGPGAGAEVTAAGVFADVLTIFA